MAFQRRGVGHRRVWGPPSSQTGRRQGAGELVHSLRVSGLGRKAESPEGRCGQRNDGVHFSPQPHRSTFGLVVGGRLCRVGLKFR